jgi:ABC-2 type transport system ATP-binding protein
MTQPSISAVALEKRYGDVHAVRGVTFDVRPGEIFGFLGRNGSGKTTTVRMLTTLTKPTGGRAFVAGIDVVLDPAAVRTVVGVTMQEAALDPNMSGREHLVFVARLWGLGRTQATQRADELLVLFGLAGDGGRAIGTYSGGMQRRLDIATSLLARPRVLFLDEPTTGLDPQSRRALWDEIRRLRNDGVTVFLTTQYLEEADQLADRLAVIDNGEVIAEGSPIELKRQHGKKHIRIPSSGAVDGLRTRLAGLPVVAHNGHLVVELDAGGSIDAVLDSVRAELGGLEGISVTDVDLEDVFVRLTGSAITAGANDPGEEAA